MFDFFLLPGVAPFSAALVLLCLIGIVEAAGLGSSAIDLDLDADASLGWLGIGRVPLILLLIAFLASFGLLGVIGQQLMLTVFGHVAPGLASVPAALIGAVPLTGLVGRALHAILPRDETTAIDRASLIGRTASIEIGTASAGSPARAKVTDQYGQAHFVMVEPDNSGQRFEQGDHVLLVRKEADMFRAIIADSPRFSDWKIV